MNRCQRECASKAHHNGGKSNNLEKTSCVSERERERERGEEREERERKRGEKREEREREREERRERERERVNEGRNTVNNAHTATDE